MMSCKGCSPTVVSCNGLLRVEIFRVGERVEARYYHIYRTRSQMVFMRVRWWTQVKPLGCVVALVSGHEA